MKMDSQKAYETNACFLNTEDLTQRSLKCRNAPNVPANFSGGQIRCSFTSQSETPSKNLESMSLQAVHI